MRDIPASIRISRGIEETVLAIVRDLPTAIYQTYERTEECARPLLLDLAYRSVMQAIFFHLMAPDLTDETGILHAYRHCGSLDMDKFSQREKELFLRAQKHIRSIVSNVQGGEMNVAQSIDCVQKYLRSIMEHFDETFPAQAVAHSFGYWWPAENPGSVDRVKEVFRECMAEVIATIEKRLEELRTEYGAKELEAALKSALQKMEGRKSKSPVPRSKTSASIPGRLS